MSINVRLPGNYSSERVARLARAKLRAKRRALLTLQAVGVQEVLALLVTLDTALHTSHTLARDAPEKALALVAVGRRRGGPRDEVVRGGRRYRVDHRLQRLLVHVHLLRVMPYGRSRSVNSRSSVTRRRGGGGERAVERKGEEARIRVSHFVFSARKGVEAWGQRDR